MSSRTMVKLFGTEHCVVFRTVSRQQKSTSFYVSREDLRTLERKSEIAVYDLNSFAVFRRDTFAGTVSIHFSWLHENVGKLTGRKEIVTLPYSRLMAFVNTGGETHERSILALDRSGVSPQFVFCDVERLRECLAKKDVRHKLLRFLRDNFHWQDSERICFYSDFSPYSFFFQEIRSGQPCLCGGLILHGQEDMGKAYYSIHT